MKFHLSRWRYWWGYSVVFLLIMLAIWFTDRARDKASWVVGGFALILFLILEGLIRFERLKVTEAGIEYRKGKSVSRLSYDSVSKLSTDQSVWQSVLRYGTLVVHSPRGDLVLFSFQDPRKIEKAINKMLHKWHEAHPHHKGLHVEQ